MIVGDIVILKSGGLKMTVEAVEANQIICCVWQTSKDETHRGKFVIDSLKSAPKGFFS